MTGYLNHLQIQIAISGSVPVHTDWYQTIPYGQKTIVLRMYRRLLFLAYQDGMIQLPDDLLSAKRGSRKSGVDRWGWPLRDRYSAKENC